MPTLEEKLSAGQTVITAEMPVIDGGGLPEIRFQLAPMKAWVDAVNATDNPSARGHASPLSVAIALKQCGVEPIMQLVCRARNRLALQSEIVGAAMHGIENILCLTGDDVTAGDEPEARRVFDLDGPQLVAVALGVGTWAFRDVSVSAVDVRNSNAHPTDKPSIGSPRSSTTSCGAAAMP